MWQHIYIYYNILYYKRRLWEVHLLAPLPVTVHSKVVLAQQVRAILGQFSQQVIYRVGQNQGQFYMSDNRKMDGWIGAVIYTVNTTNGISVTLNAQILKWTFVQYWTHLPVL